MRILLVNNLKVLPGGSLISLKKLADLLKKKGHQIQYFFGESKLRIGGVFYSFQDRKRISKALGQFKPDIVHLNNIYHYLSPSIIDEIYQRKIPMVITLRDYKLVCAVYKLWRSGKLCEQCKSKQFFYIIKNNCNLKGGSGENILLWLEMNLHHNLLHLYDKIKVFISPSKFLIQKFRQMGFKKRIEYLPNYVDVQPIVALDAKTSTTGAKTIIYFGRLAPEKGIGTLIKSFHQLTINNQQLAMNLKIIGDGPEKENLKFMVKSLKLNNVKFLGWLDGKKLQLEVANCLFTVLPSTWYENNPRSILESYALGKPVIASRIGGIPELVKDKINGLLFKPGDSIDLSQKLIWLLNHPKAIIKMGQAGKQLVKNQFNSGLHYQRLMKIYRLALNQ